MQQHTNDSLRFSGFVLMWTVALCMGIGAGARDPSFLGEALRAACGTTANRPVLLCSLVVPFLLVAWASHFNRTYLIYIIAFVVAFLDGVFVVSAGRAFGTSAWLTMFLLTFSYRLTLPLLIWFVVKQLPGKLNQSNRVTVCLLVVSCLIGILDLTVISPYLQMLTVKF